MISKNTLTTVYALADSLAQKSLTVQAKPNTIINELNRVTNSIATDTAIKVAGSVDQFNLDEFSSLIETSTYGGDTPSLHDTTIDSYTDDLKQSILSHIQFARNVVKPIVVEYAEKVIETLNSHKLESAENSFNVKVCEIPEPFEDTAFIDNLEYYEGRSALQPEQALTFAPFTSEDILPALLMGDNEVDRLITLWAQRFGVDRLAICANDMFLNRNFSNNVANAYEQIECGLICYLVANNLFNRGDRAPEGQNLTSFKNAVAEYRDYGGALALKSLELIQMYQKAELLVLSIDTRRREISVVGDLYRRWIHEGGSTELLFGMVIGNKSYKNLAQIKENAEALQKDWHAYSLFFNNSQVNKRIDVVKDILKLKFREIMETLTEEEKGYINKHSEYHGVVNRKLNMIVDKVKLSHMDDLYALALHIVCQCRFYYTDAEFILSEIEETAKQNKDLPAREAALVATIHYLVDFLCDQMFVTAKL